VAGDPNLCDACFVAVGDPDPDETLLILWRNVNSLGASGLEDNGVLFAVLVADDLLDGRKGADLISAGLDLDVVGLHGIMTGLDEDLLGVRLVIAGDIVADGGGIAGGVAQAKANSEAGIAASMVTTGPA